MSAQILLSVDKPHLSTAPGASTELVVSAQNLTALVDEVSVSLEGIDPSWVQVIPEHLPVFAQGQATARVVLRPPADSPRALAGIYPLRVRASSQENPGQEGEASSELEVQLVGDYRLYLAARGDGDGQQASYSLQVRNQANAALHVSFGGSDAEEALWFKFDPFLVTAPPGGAVEVVLGVRAKAAATERRMVALVIMGQGQYELQGGAQVAAPVRQVSGEFAFYPAATLLLSIQPGQGRGGPESSYDIRVGNPGLMPVAVHLEANDSDGQLAYTLQPPGLQLAPQSDGHATLAVRWRAQPPPGERREVLFRVRAIPEEGTAAHPGEATAMAILEGPAPAPTTQPSQGFPWWAVLIVLAFLLLLVLVLLRMRY